MRHTALLFDDDCASNRFSTGNRRRCTTWSNGQPFSLQTLNRLAPHALDAFAQLGRVFKRTVCFTLVENGFRLGRSNALDAA